jgi:hypothetical protein
MSDQRHAGDALQRLRDADPIDRASLSTRTRHHIAADPAAVRSMAQRSRPATGPRPTTAPAGRLVAAALVMVVVVAAVVVVWLGRGESSRPLPADTPPQEGAAPVDALRVSMTTPGDVVVDATVTSGGARIRPTRPLPIEITALADMSPARIRQLRLEPVNLEYDEMIVLDDATYARARETSGADAEPRWYRVTAGLWMRPPVPIPSAPALPVYAGQRGFRPIDGDVSHLRARVSDADTAFLEPYAPVATATSDTPGRDWRVDIRIDDQNRVRQVELSTLGTDGSSLLYELRLDSVPGDVDVSAPPERAGGLPTIVEQNGVLFDLCDGIDANGAEADGIVADMRDDPGVARAERLPANGRRGAALFALLRPDGDHNAVFDRYGRPRAVCEVSAVTAVTVRP